MTVRRRSRLWTFFCILTLGGCGGQTATAPAAPTPLVVDARLGVGDAFKVRVYGEDELSGQHQVGEDGTILFPFLGRVKAAGMTPEELAEVLAEQLEAQGFLRRPQVNVLVDEYVSKRVSVFGSVAKPGTFPLVSGLTVVQAVSLAGGLTSIANASEVVITRRSGETMRRITVSITKITRGQASDVQLEAGDLVFVPERVF
jgi:protein involved in polysaccharide export with SLBB domain